MHDVIWEFIMSIKNINNENMALSVVIQNGMTFKYEPNDLKTAELCFEAVKKRQLCA